MLCKRKCFPSISVCIFEFLVRVSSIRKSAQSAQVYPCKPVEQNTLPRLPPSITGQVGLRVHYSRLNAHGLIFFSSRNVWGINNKHTSLSKGKSWGEGIYGQEKSPPVSGGVASAAVVTEEAGHRRMQPRVHMEGSSATEGAGPLTEAWHLDMPGALEGGKRMCGWKWGLSWKSVNGIRNFSDPRIQIAQLCPLVSPSP